MSQPSEGATYARKIDKNEIEIDWAKDAVSVRNHIHGLSPMPGAYSTLVIGGLSDRIKILRVETVAGVGQPGSILDGALTVACGDGAIRILEAQRAGRTVVSGREFMRPGICSDRRCFPTVDINCEVIASRISSLLVSAARKI